jgi:hypothetical protein
MSTQAQIKANRRNAKKSTGPKTDKGKAAVSQNAVKHGLFAESVITGENPAEYAAFHDNMLVELAPVGMMELMLAERVVNLWWRLRRAERMQNEVIEDKIENRVTNPWAIERRKDHCYNEGLEPGDPRFEPEHLALGRIAISDWAACRILDRMLLYERRIESSLNRAMRELKRFQVVRRIEKDAEQQQSASKRAILNCGMGYRTLENMARACPEPAEGMAMPLPKYGDLKKQSQFPMDAATARAMLKIAYGDNPAGEAGENKAKQSRISACEPSEGVRKGETSASAATG